MSSQCAVPSTTWRALDEQITSKPLPRGLDAVWNAGIGLAGRCTPKRKTFLRRAGRVLALERPFSDAGSTKLKEMIRSVSEVVRRHRDTPKDLDRALALVREVAARQLGERPFLVQVAGALVLNQGCVAEMATGEGKTLTAALAATLAGWRGRGCHVITVNDYLAKRDAERMARLFRYCGLRVAHIENGMSPVERQTAYRADITYCTNKEVAADFLRDRLVLGRCQSLGSALLEKLADEKQPVMNQLVQRGLNHAILDEADSILIDEAVTPLIISGAAPNLEQTEALQQAAEVAAQLDRESDYRIDGRYRDVELTDAGRKRLAQCVAGWTGIWRGPRQSEEWVVRAIIAKELYTLDHQYVIDEGKVVVVDESTGRLMPDRQWRDGLHQAVEAKEGIEVTDRKETQARVSFQRFFRSYRKLSGMSGTVREAAAEFWEIYQLPVVPIPTHRPCLRHHFPDRVFTHETAKWDRIVEEIEKVHQTGRPILVGTRSIRASESLSQRLHAMHLGHQVLNAVRHQEEAQIVAGAGQPGRITVATNMAGRGTDIKLGRGVAEMGGLHVIATERNESGRIDRQLFGRCARQGDPGSVQTILSLEDEFLSRYARGLARLLQKRYGRSGDDIAGRWTHSAFRIGQLRAERLALRRRKAVTIADHWLDERLSFAGRP